MILQVWIYELKVIVKVPLMKLWLNLACLSIAS